MNIQSVYVQCTRSLKSYVENAGFDQVVLGLSGGMDSSLVAVMCADAFGPGQVHGVLMPGPYSSTHSVEDATTLAQNLGIAASTVSINEPYQAFVRALTNVCDGPLQGLAAENTQARCRMVCLMALSNAFGWMLVNTGNKSEALMGYSTLYGDTAGAFAPLGGLYKTEVNEVARWRNMQAQKSGERPPIPPRVFTKPPSAELAPDQEDEKSLGLNYATLDVLLADHVDKGLDASQLEQKGYDPALVQRIVRTVAGSAFKRGQEPPFPLVTLQGVACED